MGSVPGGLRMTEEREEALRQAYGLLQRTPTRTLISYLPVLGEFAVDKPPGERAERLGLKVHGVPQPIEHGKAG